MQVTIRHLREATSLVCCVAGVSHGKGESRKEGGERGLVPKQRRSRWIGDGHGGIGLTLTETANHGRTDKTMWGSLLAHSSSVNTCPVSQVTPSSSSKTLG